MRLGADHRNGMIVGVPKPKEERRKHRNCTEFAEKFNITNLHNQLIQTVDFTFVDFFSVNSVQFLRFLRYVFLLGESTILDANALPLRGFSELALPARHAQIKINPFIVQMRDDARAID
jgi:hypothetical protein